MKHSDNSLPLVQVASLLTPAYSTRLSWRGCISSSSSRLISSTVKVRVPALRRNARTRRSTSSSVRESLRAFSAHSACRSSSSKLRCSCCISELWFPRSSTTLMPRACSSSSTLSFWNLPVSHSAPAGTSFGISFGSACTRANGYRGSTRCE